MTDKVLTKGDRRGVFYDLFNEDEAAELAMRAQLVNALQVWMDAQHLRQAEIGERLGIDQPRVSGLKKGNVERFSLEKLVQMAQRAGLRPRLQIAA